MPQIWLSLILLVCQCAHIHFIVSNQYIIMLDALIMYHFVYYIYVKTPDDYFIPTEINAFLMFKSKHYLFCWICLAKSKELICKEAYEKIIVH